MRREFLIGLFSFIAIILFIGGVLWIKGKDIFGKETLIGARFSDATGIEPGVYVYLRGVKVGEVRKVKIMPDGVIVEFSVRKDIAIPEDSKVYAESRGLFEDKTLSLVPGTSPRILIRGMVLEGIRKENIMEMLGEVDVKEIISALREFRDFAQSGKKTLENTQILLKDFSEKLERIGKSATPSIESAGKELKELNSTIKELSALFKEGPLGGFVSDTLFYQSLLRTLIRLDSVLVKFQKEPVVRVKFF